MKNFVLTFLLLCCPFFVNAQTATITMDYINQGSGSFCFSPGARCQVNHAGVVVTSDSTNSVYGCPTLNVSDGNQVPFSDGSKHPVRFSGCASPVDIAQQDDGSVTTTFAVNGLRAYDSTTGAFLGNVTGTLNAGMFWGYQINVKHGRAYTVTTAHASFAIAPSGN